MKYKVLVDIGHGGNEIGALAKNGELEKDINLDVGKYLNELSKQYEDNIEFIFTRLEDKTVSLKERIHIANINQVNLAISIHHNAYNKKTSGSEVIHSINGGKGQEFANMIMEEFVRLGQSKRRVFSKESNVDENKDYYYFIRHTAMPSVITEYAFVDSDDFDDIDNPKERKGQAQAILNAILRYFDIEKKDEIEEWKVSILNDAYSIGMFKDYAYWKSQLNETMPVWGVMAMIYNTYNKQ